MIAPLPERLFSQRDWFSAHWKWGATDGHAVLAIMTGRRLEHVRTVLRPWRAAHSAEEIAQALIALGVAFDPLGADAGWPGYGLARVEWAPGSGAGHWLGIVSSGWPEPMVWDASGGGDWMKLGEWNERVRPWLAECLSPRATGWRIGSGIELILEA